MRKISYINQTDLRDCGVSCLMSLVKYYKGYVSREYLREITHTTKEGTSVYSMIEAGKVLGFEAQAVKCELNHLNNHYPVIAHVLIEQKYGHFVIIIKANSNDITIMDPSSGIKKITIDKWQEITTNVYLIYKPKTKILKEDFNNNFFKLLKPIIKTNQLTISILLFLSTIYTLSNILISYQFQFFIELLNLDNFKTIKLIFIFLIGVIFLKELTDLFRNSIINYLNHFLDKTFLKEIYQHIIRLPYLYFKNRTKGDIITRIQDIFIIRDLISKLFITLAIDLVLVLILFVFILKISSKLAFITFVTTIFYVLVIYLYNNLITKKVKALKEKESIVNNHLIETVESINTIKGMQLETQQEDKLMFKYDEYQNVSFKLFKKTNQASFFKSLVYDLGLSIIIYLGIKEVSLNNLSLSKLLVLNSLLIYYFTPIQNICNLHFLIKEAKVSLIRIKELLNIKCEELVIDKTSLNKHLIGNIKITNLKFSYNTKNNLICNKLEIKAGSKVLLYGNSGGGKSTLMKLLVKYFADYEGIILLDDRNLRNYNLLDIRNKITYISQDEMIYTDTVYNNIVLNSNISFEKYLEIIKLTGVDKIIEKSLLKDGMYLDFAGGNLSGGERQKIILARALAKNSDIYIFDESLSAIDIKNERMILKNIFSYLKGKTVIVISHRFNNRDLYQKYVLIDKNGVVYEY